MNTIGDLSPTPQAQKKTTLKFHEKRICDLNHIDICAPIRYLSAAGWNGLAVKSSGWWQLTKWPAAAYSSSPVLPQPKLYCFFLSAPQAAQLFFLSQRLDNFWVDWTSLGLQNCWRLPTTGWLAMARLELIGADVSRSYNNAATLKLLTIKFLIPARAVVFKNKFIWCENKDATKTRINNIIISLIDKHAVENSGFAGSYFEKSRNLRHCAIKKCIIFCECSSLVFRIYVSRRWA